MAQLLAADTFKAKRKMAVRRLGKPIIRRIDRFLADSSLVPATPVMDNALFPWVKGLEDNWRAIREEMDGILRYRDVIPRFQDLSPDQYKISPDDQWKTFVLFGFGYRAETNCRLCPRTTAILEKVPGLQTAFFSILAPGKHVPRHKGITKTFVRCHLGLKVPQDKDNCWMDVDGTKCVWEEGKAFVFDDTFPHEVRNDTTEERVVLLIDVERPMTSPATTLSRAMMWLFKRTAYVHDARRNNDLWEKRLADRLAEERAAGQRAA